MYAFLYRRDIIDTHEILIQHKIKELMISKNTHKNTDISWHRNLAIPMLYVLVIDIVRDAYVQNKTTLFMFSPPDCVIPQECASFVDRANYTHLYDRLVHT